MKYTFCLQVASPEFAKSYTRYEPVYVGYRRVVIDLTERGPTVDGVLISGDSVAFPTCELGNVTITHIAVVDPDALHYTWGDIAPPMHVTSGTTPVIYGLKKMFSDVAKLQLI